jgi:hypothetical protein
MAGLRKSRIARRLTSILESSGCRVYNPAFVGLRQDLPWECTISFPDGCLRDYALYFWTISHGGRTRSRDEYRIQAKLKANRSLHFGRGTTLLLGYYSAKEDGAGRRAGNSPYDGMELFVAWDPLQHIYLGASSSCQVSYDVLLRAFLSGCASGLRRTRDGSTEVVIAVTADRLQRYLRCAAGGHNSVDPQHLLAAERIGNVTK